MAAPQLLRRLFDSDGFGSLLNKEIVPQPTIPYTSILYTEDSTFVLSKSCPVRITCVGGGGYINN